MCGRTIKIIWITKAFRTRLKQKHRPLFTFWMIFLQSRKIGENSPEIWIFFCLTRQLQYAMVTHVIKKNFALTHRASPAGNVLGHNQSPVTTIPLHKYTRSKKERKSNRHYSTNSKNIGRAKKISIAIRKLNVYFRNWNRRVQSASGRRGNWVRALLPFPWKRRFAYSAYIEKILSESRDPVWWKSLLVYERWMFIFYTKFGRMHKFGVWGRREVSCTDFIFISAAVATFVLEKLFEVYN